MEEQLQNELVFGEESGHTQTYTKLSDKYEDLMSSALTLFFMGIIGLVLLILVYFKVIPFPLVSSTSWLFDIVMGGLFIAFIIGGIISYMKATKLKVKADAEDQLISDILSWAEENIQKDSLESDLDSSQPEEILYFSRFDNIKDLLMHKFEESDEALIDEMSETIYQKIYESNED